MSDLIPFQQPSTPKEFLRVFNRLSVALREPMDNSGVKADVYFQALVDLPLESIVEASNGFMREAGRKYFPTTGEWRGRAVTVNAERLRLAVQPPTDRREWRVECELCDDCGWRLFHCDGTNHGFCGRRLLYDHYPHLYAAPCDCRPTNRTYQRHHV